MPANRQTYRAATQSRWHQQLWASHKRAQSSLQLWSCRRPQRLENLHHRCKACHRGPSIVKYTADLQSAAAGCLSECPSSRAAGIGDSGMNEADENFFCVGSSQMWPIVRSDPAAGQAQQAKDASEGRPHRHRRSARLRELHNTHEYISFSSPRHHGQWANSSAKRQLQPQQR